MKLAKLYEELNDEIQKWLWKSAVKIIMGDVKNGVFKPFDIVILSRELSYQFDRARAVDISNFISHENNTKR